jgi:hypothetical protein
MQDLTTEATVTVDNHEVSSRRERYPAHGGKPPSLQGALAFVADVIGTRVLFELTMQFFFKYLSGVSGA